MTEHANILLLSAYAATLTMTVLFRSALPALLVLTAFVISVIIDMCPNRSISAMLFLCVVTPVIQSALLFSISKSFSLDTVKTIMFELVNGEEFAFVSATHDANSAIRRASNIFLILAITGWYAVASEATHVTHFPIGFMMANMLTTLCIVVYTKTFGETKDVLTNSLLALCTVLLFVPISVQMQPEYVMYLTIVGTQAFCIPMGVFINKYREPIEQRLEFTHEMIIQGNSANEQFFATLTNYRNKTKPHARHKPSRQIAASNL